MVEVGMKVINSQIYQKNLLEEIMFQDIIHIFQIGEQLIKELIYMEFVIKVNVLQKGNNL